jgi:hypothetical protein
MKIQASKDKSSRKPHGPGKVGARSGKPAFKARSSRAVRHLSKQALDEVASENDRAEAKLADQIYRTAHPEPLIEALVLGSGKPGKKKPTAAAAKKRAAQALLKELDAAARHKSERKAKRRASARALKKARAG